MYIILNLVCELQVINSLPLLPINFLQEILYIYIWRRSSGYQDCFPSYCPAVRSSVFLPPPPSLAFFLFLNHFLHLFFPLSLPVSYDPDRWGTKEMEKDLKCIMYTHTHTPLLYPYLALLYLLPSPSPGHSVPGDAGKAPGGAKLTWWVLNAMWHVCKCEVVRTCGIYSILTVGTLYWFKCNQLYIDCMC